VIALPRHGLGTAPLGGMFHQVSDDDAAATVRAALDAGTTFFDTAPQYGHGLAESRLGRALRGEERDRLTISTKVGRVLVPGTDPGTIFHDIPPVRPEFDYSSDGVRRSLDASFERLGLQYVELALVHDPDHHEAEARAMAFPALQRLRDEGVIGGIGCGMNQVAMLDRFVADAELLGLDAILLAGRWSLLDRSGAALLDRCGEQGVAVIVGGVFNSGVLARPEPGATFDYATAPATLVARARAMAEMCDRHGVSLSAAALQFPWRHPAVTSVIVGARTPAEVVANATSGTTAVPEELWAELDRLAAG
jgi:D-threo-aldose 1-dehydrogenase